METIAERVELQEVRVVKIPANITANLIKAIRPGFTPYLHGFAAKARPQPIGLRLGSGAIEANVPA